MTTQEIKKIHRAWWVQEAINDLETKVFGISAGLGSGKAMSLDSKILTPTGWTTHGAIKKGDDVLTPDNKIAKVINIFPQGKRDLYKVTFDDGSTCIADLDHLFLCSSINDRKHHNSRMIPRTLREIKDRIKYKSGKVYCYSYHIPLLNKLCLKEKKFEIEPYLLGLFLGDGSCCNCAITSKDDFIFQEVKRLYPNSAIRIRKNRCNDIKLYDFHKVIKNLNLNECLSYDKFIPSIYFLGSHEQRLELLQGLLDTDGCNAGTGTVEFSTTSKKLAEDVRQLAYSLGIGCNSIITRKGSYCKNGIKIETVDNYRVYLRIPEHITPFKLERKIKSFKKRGEKLKKYNLHRKIVSVDFYKNDYAVCIEIDSNEHLYITDNYIVTHNTHGACDWHHDRVLLNDKSPFSCFSMPIYQKIHDAAIPTFRKVFENFGYVEGVHFKVLKTPFPKIIYPHNGHEIHFISANRPDKIVAVEYSHATGSESGTQSKDAIDLVRTRIRCPKAKALQSLWEGAPQGLNHFADLFNNIGNSSWVERAERDYINNNGKSRLRRFRLTSYDNPFLPDGYIDELLQIYKGNQPYINSYIFGIFCALVEGSAYNYFGQQLVINDIDPDPHTDIYLTWDFNANPLAWVSCQKLSYYEYNERVQRFVAIHEANNGSATIAQACVEFAFKHPPEKFALTPIRLFGDSSGHASSHKIEGSDYQQIEKCLRELGYKVIVIEALRSNPSETVSVEALNTWFRDDKFYICKRCMKLQRSLLSTRWKEGVKKLDKPNKDDWTHWSDALKYLAYAMQTTGTKILKQMV